MVDAVFPQFEHRAQEHLHALSTQTVQLLAMLEVVHYSVAQDATYIVELAGTLEAFTASVGTAALTTALDPGARGRTSLQLSGAKAHALYRSAQHMARISANEIASVHTLVALALNRLLSICERLYEMVCKHDHPFECGDACDNERAVA